MYLCCMKTEQLKLNLRTIRNYAAACVPPLTTSAVYKQIKSGAIECIEIDGVKFIHIKKA